MKKIDKEVLRTNEKEKEQAKEEAIKLINKADELVVVTDTGMGVVASPFEMKMLFARGMNALYNDGRFTDEDVDKIAKLSKMSEEEFEENVMDMFDGGILSKLKEIQKMIEKLGE